MPFWRRRRSALITLDLPPGLTARGWTSDGSPIDIKDGRISVRRPGEYFVVAAHSGVVVAIRVNWTGSFPWDIKRHTFYRQDDRTRVWIRELIEDWAMPAPASAFLKRQFNSAS